MIDTVTIVGRVATEPTPGRTSAGVPVTNFRLASTHRRFDAASGSWVDAGTNWFSIAAFRQLAEHARASLRVGDSVIVSGRLRVRPWESNGKQGTSVDIDADTIGHDLRWGTTAYRPSTRPSPTDAEESGHVPTTDEEGRDAWEQPAESEAA
ncbi:single-stranded DNA-binding protein [Microbacterium paraoxydans]|uniref:single-stranded DNA-binding protein n=1 Tax=Microbacterium paraoxydans TaxID=199592 RepID=UPI0022854364|nr:single-stranded DNA-binding protein [Microbacterium paraoxydans]MCZ0708704.1 single-stranded DNA-binding protein [Microbacterium paraoxydans]